MIMFLVFFEGEGIFLKDSIYYIISVRYNDFMFFLFFMLASDIIDYMVMVVVYNLVFGFVLQYVSVLDVGNDGIFNMFGFGYNIVLVVRLYIGELFILIQIVEMGVWVVGIIVSLNFVDEIFEVYFKGDFVVKEVGLRVIDVLGKIVFDQEIKDFFNKSFIFVVCQLFFGWYIVWFEMVEGNFIKFLIIQY